MSLHSARTGFVFQAASLLLAAAVVHTAYVTLVWPRGDAQLAAQQARMQVDPGYVQERSLWVILRDYEQEAEIVLMLWALAIIADKVARLHTAGDGGLQRSFEGAADWLYDIDVHLATARVVSGSYNGQVHVWNVDTGEKVLTWTAAPGSAP